MAEHAEVPASEPKAPAIPFRQIRAHCDDKTITVYQAYSAEIATAAVSAQRLTASPAFKRGRMTWIKPSWCWMMYRAGYSHKDSRQSRILALRMAHADFISLLRRAALTHGDQRGEGDVRVQWDPERGPWLDKREYRSIQIGIPGGLSGQWAEEWIVGIEDVTEKARELKRVVDEEEGIMEQELVRRGLVPAEREFPVPDDVKEKLRMS